MKRGTRHCAAATVTAAAPPACLAIQFATMHFGAAGAGAADKSHRLQGLAIRTGQGGADEKLHATSRPSCFASFRLTSENDPQVVRSVVHRIKLN